MYYLILHQCILSIYFNEVLLTLFDHIFIPLYTFLFINLIIYHLHTSIITQNVAIGPDGEPLVRGGGNGAFSGIPSTAGTNDMLATVWLGSLITTSPLATVW